MDEKPFGVLFFTNFFVGARFEILISSYYNGHTILSSKGPRPRRLFVAMLSRVCIDSCEEHIKVTCVIIAAVALLVNVRQATALSAKVQTI